MYYNYNYDYRNQYGNLFDFHFLLVGGALVGVTRPRPVYVNGPAYQPYPYYLNNYYPGMHGTYSNSYYGYY